MRRDTEVFTRLYAGVVKDLYRLALYMLKNKEDAEDIVGDTALAAFSEMESLRDEGLFKYWIIKILSNKCKMKLKEYALSKKISFVNDEEVMGISDMSISNKRMVEGLEIKDLLMKLDDTDRLIICLSVFEGYKSKEISEITGITDTTVRSRKSRALAKLAAYMEA